jgi:hypothetical protein
MSRKKMCVISVDGISYGWTIKRLSPHLLLLRVWLAATLLAMLALAWGKRITGVQLKNFGFLNACAPDI